MLVILVVLVAILLSGPPPAHRVTATFSGVTNAPGGPVAVFNLANYSPLVVHVFAQQINGVFIPCPTETILPRKSATISAPIPPATDTTGSKTNTVSLSSPIAVEFHLRRQDTHLEEAREMLDSVFQTVRITIPGLNPDSSRNLFQISATIPAQD